MMLTINKLIEIFKNIDFDDLKLKSGISEYKITNPDITLGIIYKDIEKDNKGFYIFNLYLYGGYIEIYGKYPNPYDAIDIIVEDYNYYQYA